MKIKKLFFIPAILLLIQPLLLSYNENEEGFPSSFDRELFEPFKSINAGYNAQADNLEKELNDASNTYSNISTASSTSDATNKMDNAANQKRNEKEQQEHTAEEKIEEYKTQSQDMQDSINSSVDGDPVRITQGAYEQNETDISFGKNLVFKIMRKYSSQNPVTSSFGYGWSTNLDERILFGTLTNCHEVEQALTNYVDKMKETVDKMEKLIISSYSVPNIDNAYSAFSSRITTCRDVINKASQLYSSLDSLTSSSSGYSAQARILGLRNSAHSLKDSATSKLYSLESGLSQLSKDLTLLQKYKQEYQKASQELSAYRQKVNLSNQRKENNAYARFEGLPPWYEETGLNTITLIDQDNYPHILYETSAGSGVWENDQDSEITSCQKITGGLRVFFKDGIEKIFDSNGFIIQIKDRNQNSTEITRLSNGRIQNIQTSWGESFTVIYNDRFISKIVNQRDNTQTISYSYNSDSLSCVTNDKGNTVTMNYDSNKRMNIQKNDDGTMTTFTYGQITSSGNVLTTQTCDEEGFEEYFSYDLSQKKTVYLDHDRNETTYFYDSSHRTIKVIKPDGSFTQTLYDAKGRISRLIQNGDSTYYSYENNKTRISYSDGTYELYAYDNYMLQTYFKDRDGIVYEYIRDNHGNLLEYKISGQTIYTQCFDNRGNVIKKTIYNKSPVITEYQYDNFDNLIKETTDGKVTSYEYDHRNRCTKIIKDKKTQSTISYSGNQTVQTDINGLETTYIVNNRNNITTLIQKDTITGVTHRTRIEYDKRQLPVKVYSGNNDSQSLITEYYYTPQGRISSQNFYDSQGNISFTKYYYYKNAKIECIKLKAESQDEISYKYNFKYSNNGQTLVTITNAQEHSTIFGYDAWGNLISQTNANGDILENDWSPAGRLKKIQNEWGGFYEYDYDNTGSLITKPNEKYNQIFEYDYLNRITKQTITEVSSPNKPVYYITYEYLDNNRTVTITEGGKYKTTYNLDAFGNIIKQTDGNGNTIEYEYNSQNQLIAVFDGYMNKTEIEYNAIGKIKAFTLPDGAKTQYEYNSLGQVIKAIDDCGVLYEAKYDKGGNLIKEKYRADSEKSYSYDNINRITKTSIGGQVIQSYSYNQQSKKISVTDGNGFDYLYEFDSFGKLISETNRLGKMREYTYDSDGNLLPNQNNLIFNEIQNIIQAHNDYSDTLYEYDKGGRLILQKEITTGEEIHFEYDTAGNRTRLYSSNRDTRYTYGRNNELKEIFDNKQRVSVQLDYDKNGREVLRRFGNGTMEQTRYDKAGRTILKTQTNSQGEILWGEGYIYGPDGKRTATIDANASVTLYEYNKQGRLSAVYYPYTKEHEELLKKQVQENGLSTNGQAVSNHYLSTNQKSELSLRLNQLHYTLASSLSTMQLFIKVQYSYDKNGNCIAQTTPFGIIEYTYDKENRLISSGSNGQVFTSFTYDDNGNLILEQSDCRTAEYSYNELNRLISSLVIDKLEKTFTQTKYAYDSFGRRIFVQDFDEPAMRTIYDGFTFDVIKQGPVYANQSFTNTYQTNINFDSTGNPTGDRYRFIYDSENYNDRYIYLDGNNYKAVPSHYKGERFQFSINGSITAQTSSDTSTSYFSKDLLGSICCTTDSYGSLKQLFIYNALGSLVQGSLLDSIDLGYNGKQYNPATKSYNFGLRDYNPQIARFTTEDPIRYGHNWFTYCQDDPINFIDPWGLCERTRETPVMMGKDLGELDPSKSSDAYALIKNAAETYDLIGKQYSTDSDNVYVCTTFVIEALEKAGYDSNEYLPGGQRVVDSIKKLDEKLITPEEGKNPPEGTYVFYHVDNDNVTGHTGIIYFDKNGNATILHNGSDGNGNRNVNERYRDGTRGSFSTWFPEQNNAVKYLKIGE